MAVGSQFARYLNPLLLALKQLGGSAKPAEARAAVAELMQLPDQVLEDTIESGSSRFGNQVAWARYYLVRSGYLDSSRRGVWALTEKGRQVTSLTEAEVAEIVKGVIAEWGRRDSDPADAPISPEENEPPDEPTRDYRTQLRDLLLNLPAGGFERLCQRLLREAGFERVVVTGRSGDGGIDGIGVLELNHFVSFKVLFQCKRYKDKVGPGVVRDFRGAVGRAGARGSVTRHKMPGLIMRPVNGPETRESFRAAMRGRGVFVMASWRTRGCGELSGVAVRVGYPRLAPWAVNSFAPLEAWAAEPETRHLRTGLTLCRPAGAGSGDGVGVRGVVCDGVLADAGVVRSCRAGGACGFVTRHKMPGLIVSPVEWG